MNSGFSRPEARRYDDRVLILQTLGIIFVVLGHTGDSVPLLSSWFPYYSFHMPLFIFISGYLYETSNEECIGKFIAHKVKKQILPFYGWLFIYGAIGDIFLNLGIVTYGQKMSLTNLFINPWTEGCKYSFTAAWWFIPVLFGVQVVNVIIRRFIPVKPKIKEVIIQLLYIVCGIVAVEYARKVGGKYGGQMPEWVMILTEIAFAIPFFQLGHIFKHHIGLFIDSIKPGLFYGTVFLIQSVLFLTQSKSSGALGTYVLVHLNFEYGWFLTFLETFTGIVLWFRISGELLPALKKHTAFLTIGKNTWSILLHHEFVIYLLQYLLLQFQAVGLFMDMESSKLFGNYWYMYRPHGIVQFGLVYVVAGISIPILIAKGIRRIKNWIINRSKMKLS